MAAHLTKSLIVPQWDARNVVLYTPSTNSATLGQAVLNPNFTVDQTVLAPLFENTPSSPNVCLISGTDLFIAVSGDAAGVVKVPGYLADPLTAKSNAFVIDLNGNDYVGLAMDASGNLYAAVGEEYGDNDIFRYAGAGSATGGVTGVSLGNAGKTSYFGDMVFDSSGNLWAADYLNNRLVVFEALSLSGPGPATWLALENPASSGTTLAPANTAAGFPATVAYLFASPEGVDFDSFGPNANLWVGNNNDASNGGHLQIANTTLIQLTPGLLNKLRQQLVNGPNNTAVTIDGFTANTDFRIYQVPQYPTAIGSNQKPQFGGLQIDKATGWLYVNDETNDPGNGWVRAYNLATLASIPDTPADTSSELVSNAVTSQSGNGGLVVLNLGPYVGDTASDTVTPFEPDASAATAPNVAWESPNIVATIENTAGLTVLPVPYADPEIGIGPDGSDTVLGGATRYIYVQVNNFGPATTTGLEQLNLYWAKGSSTLNWPQPWDGNGPTDPLANEPLGGIIVVGQAIPAIAGFGQVIIGPVAWNTPDPTKYSVQDGHFCLLARIVTPNANYAENTSTDPANPPDSSLLAFAGMSFPETSGAPSDINANVINNARIAWRNIHIVAVEPGGGGGAAGPAIHRGAVVATNFGAASLNLRIAFELLDSKMRPVPIPAEPLAVYVAGRALALLERAVGALFHHDAKRPNEARHEVHDIATGIEKLRLEPGENLTFHIEYKAPDDWHEYALRAKVFATEAGEERLVGGQTFIYRRVEGFRDR